MDISFLEAKLKNTTVDKPLSGTLSGHAAGEPFDKHVESLLKTNSKDVYRQYEYLNKLYQENESKKTFKERSALIPFESVQYLLNRGKDVTKKWSSNNLFEEKQNDTADILVVENEFYQILDVKTRNVSKNAQAPNIISSYKLANMCDLILEHEEFNAFNITYIGIDWELNEDKLVCKDAYVRELFRCPPNELYINWTAGEQVQVHVDELDQSYAGNVQEWANEYLEYFISKAEERIEKLKTKWITNFK